MDNLYNQKVLNANDVFAHDFLDVKALYLYSFNSIPSIHFIRRIDAEKAFMAVKEKFLDTIKDIYQRKWYKREAKKFQFDDTIVVMDSNCMLLFEDNYCEILHDGKNEKFLNAIIEEVIRYKRGKDSSLGNKPDRTNP